MKRILSIIVFFLCAISSSMGQFTQEYLQIIDENNVNKASVSLFPSKTDVVKTGVDSEGNFYAKEYNTKTNSVTYSLVSTKLKPEFSRIYEFSEDEEREALMEFYQALGGEKWVNHDNWGSNLPVSEWYGVMTETDTWGSGKSYVRGISLPYNNLVGQLPNDALQKLKNLRSLFLPGSNINGDIPKSLNKLGDFVLRDNYGSINTPLPEKPWSDLMNYMADCDRLGLANISDGWQVPEWAEKHERFKDFWVTLASIPKGTPGQDYFDYWNNKIIPMADFSIVDNEGKIHTNSDFSRAKLTVIYNWESWCAFSKAFNKKLVPAYKQLHSKGLNVLGISTLCPNAIPCVDEEAYLKYIYDANIPWPNCYESSVNDIKALKVGSPSVFAVDNEGKIIYQSFTQGYDNLIPFLEEFFGEKITEQAYYTSSDYSKDGEVQTLQTATEGSGIDLVIMGDAFIDYDMNADGNYETMMRKAMEQFFAVEPYKSFRNRFNVKAVKVVSPNEEFASDAKHSIAQDDQVAFKYAKKAIGADADKAMVMVVYNATAATGRSYTTMYEDGSFVAYCMDGVSTVLNHEAGGHGFAFLADEYIEPGNESLTLPTERKDELDKAHAKDWYMNVDYNQGSQSTWKDYFIDSRYSSENIGSYEGAFLYGKGCYRPTENSMMRFNDAPFNAPSREAIYKRIMTLSDPSYKYSHEDFVKFDIATSKSVSQAKGQGKTEESLGNINYTVKASVENPNRFPPKRFLPKSPVLKKGSWKDNL